VKGDPLLSCRRKYEKELEFVYETQFFLHEDAENGSISTVRSKVPSSLFVTSASMSSIFNNETLNMWRLSQKCRVHITAGEAYYLP
jgi:hypothetical protein